MKELAKEFRKRNGKNTPAEIVLVGGVAVLANYGFREMTYDIDAVITASSAMKEAVHEVGDRPGLPKMGRLEIRPREYRQSLGLSV